MPNYCGRWATAAASLQLSHCAPAQHSPLRFILSNTAPGKVRGVPAAKVSGWGMLELRWGMAEPPQCHLLEMGPVGMTVVRPAVALEYAVMRLAAKQCPALSLSPARGVLVTPKGQMGYFGVIAMNLIFWGGTEIPIQAKYRGGLGHAGLTLRPDDLKGFFQPKQFCNSMI